MGNITDDNHGIFRWTKYTEADGVDVYVDPDNTSGAASDSNPDPSSRSTPWLHLPADQSDFAGTYTKATQRKIAVMGEGVVYRSSDPLRALNLNNYNGTEDDPYIVFPVDADHFTIDARLYPTGWEVHSGNVWKTTASLDTFLNVGLATAVYRVFIDDESVGHSTASSAATVTAAAPFWFDSGTGILYLYSTNAGGPGAEGTVSVVYGESAKREVVRPNNADWVILQGINLEGGQYSWRMQGTAGTDNALIDCRFRFYYTHGVYAPDVLAPHTLVERCHIDRRMVSADTDVNTEGLGDGIELDSANCVVRHLTGISCGHNVLSLTGNDSLAEFIDIELDAAVESHCRLFTGAKDQTGLIIRHAKIRNQSTSSHCWGNGSLFHDLVFEENIDHGQAYNTANDGVAFNFSNDNSVGCEVSNVHVQGADKAACRFSSTTGVTLVANTVRNVSAYDCGREDGRVFFNFEPNSGTINTQTISDIRVHSPSGAAQIRKRDDSVVAVASAPADFSDLADGALGLDAVYAPTTGSACLGTGSETTATTPRRGGPDGEIFAGARDNIGARQSLTVPDTRH